MSKGLNTTAGLKAEWARLKEQVTGEKAPPAQLPSVAPSSAPDRSTTKGIREAWNRAKESVINPKRAELRAKVELLRKIDPEGAAEIDREIERLDAADKQEK